MNKIQLMKELKKLDVPTDAYTLSGGLPNEKYCLEERAGKWYVYYSERGSKTGEMEFSSESEACSTMLDKLKKLI